MSWLSINLQEDRHVVKLAVAVGVCIAVGVGSYSLVLWWRQREKGASNRSHAANENNSTERLVTCLQELNEVVSNLSSKTRNSERNGTNDSTDGQSRSLEVCVDKLADEVNQLRIWLEKTQDNASSSVATQPDIVSQDSSDNFYDVDQEDDDDEIDCTYGRIERFFSCESLENLAANRQVVKDKISASNLSEDLNSIDQLHDQLDINSRRLAVDKVKDIFAKHQENVQVLWRYARAYYDICEIGIDSSDAKRMVYDALSTAKRAIEIEDNCCEAHKWYALLLGATLTYEGSKKKIEVGYEFKKHMDKSLQLNPHDYEVIGYIGRWCYECASLSWYERKGAALLFGEVPSVTISEALEYLHKAENMHPGFSKTNRLYLAKCYLYEKDYDRAREWLMQGKDLPIVTVQDTDAGKEIEKLLQKC